MIRANGVKHVARFWLKDPGDAPQIERRIEQLAGIPQVIDLIVGPPLDSDWGRQIDKSYDLAFVMTFRDLEDCRTYFLDGLHQRLAGEIERIAERIEAFYVEY